MSWLARLVTSRLAGPIASGLSAVLLLALVLVTLSKNASIRGLDRSINDPKSGYVVRLQTANADLAQCRANTATMEAAATRQNAAIEAERRDSEARLAALDQAAGQARTDADAASARAQAILHHPATGNACTDADALILENAR